MKSKIYTVINGLGLCISLTACLFIFLYVKDELSYDRFHHEADDIYRIALTLKFGDLDVFIPMASSPLGGAMTENIPEVKESIRLYGINVNHSVRHEDKTFTEKKILYADSTFFSFFSFKLRAGDSRSALTQPNSIVLTEATAQKYFETFACLGKTLLVDGQAFTITGVAETPPTQSHIVFDALLSMQSLPLASSHSWMGNRFLTYIKLVTHGDVNAAEQKMDQLVMQNIGPDLLASQTEPSLNE